MTWWVLPWCSSSSAELQTIFLLNVYMSREEHLDCAPTLDPHGITALGAKVSRIFNSPDEASQEHAKRALLIVIKICIVEYT